MDDDLACIVDIVREYIAWEDEHTSIPADKLNEYCDGVDKFLNRLREALQIIKGYYRPPYLCPDCGQEATWGSDGWYCEYCGAFVDPAEFQRHAESSLRSETLNNSEHESTIVNSQDDTPNVPKTTTKVDEIVKLEDKR